MKPFSLSQHLTRSAVNVMDWPYGAKGDGVTDDTAAIQAAIDLFTFPAGTPTSDTCGGTIYFPQGVYVVGDLVIQNVVSTNNGGLNGLRLIGDNAVLKGKASATKILSIKTNSTSENISGITVEGFQFDLTAMTMAGVGTSGLHIANAYRCTFRDLHFYGGPASNTHIQFAHSGSQISLYDIHAARIRIEGDDYGAAQLVWTTMNFHACSWVDMLIDKAWGLNFWACVAQNPAVAAFKMSNCDTISIIGGDYEGAGGIYLDLTAGNIGRIYSQGNRTSSLGTYILGNAAKSQFLDRNGGPDAVAFSAGRGTVGAAATTIYTFEGDPILGAAAYTYAELTVFGDNGASGFVDKVAVAFGGVVTVLSSHIAYGAPAARTYSFVNPYLLKLAVAADTYQVKAVALSSPYS
jgi:Pectate lyase superfamily protein